MPATTSHGAPYPLGTDRVADGDNAIQSLAQWTDDKTMCWGAATLAATNNISGTQDMSNHVAIGTAGGVTVDANGLVLPLKGWWEVRVVGHLTGPTTAFCSVTAVDGAAITLATAQSGPLQPGWGVTTTGLAYVNVPAAGYRVRLRTITGGSGGPVNIYAGADKTSIFARLITPIP